MNNKKQTGFTLLELIVTLAILALLVTALVTILDQTSYQVAYLSEELSRRSSVAYSLDQLMDDVVSQGGENVGIQVKRNESRETCWLTLTINTSEPKGKGAAIRQIDWVAVPREDEDDLVLFRREKAGGDKDEESFIPQCDQLESFEVRLLNGLGMATSPSETPALIEVEAKMYRQNDKDDGGVLTFRRTFALKRFEK